MSNLPLELVDLICTHIKPELLVKYDLLPELNTKRIEHYWKHRCPCCLVENNDLQGIKYNMTNSNYNLTVIFDLFFKASKCGHLNIIKYFISLKIITIPIKSIGFIHATKNNDFSMVKYLADQGAEASFNNDHALIIACENGNLSMVKYMISLGADITTLDNEPVITACKKGNFRIVRYLAELDDEILNDYRVLEWAAWSGNIRLVEYLIYSGGEIDDKILIKACENGRLEMVKYLVSVYKSFMNYTRKEWSKPVIAACASGNIRLVEYLVTLGADINTRENSGVYKAIKNGHLRIVKYFVNKGVDIIKNSRAIITASGNGHLNIVKYLVSLGMKLDVITVSIGCDSGNIKLVKYMINLFKNSSENYPGFYNQLLINACHNGFIKIVKYMISLGADVKAENNTPLLYAIFHNDLKVAKHLIKNGAEPFDSEMITSAVKQGCLEMVKYLVNQGADFRVQSDLPLQLANDHGHEEIVEYLTSLGAKLPDDYVYVDRTSEYNGFDDSDNEYSGIETEEDSDND
jgi:ankyrin repeat protein